MSTKFPSLSPSAAPILGVEPCPAPLSPAGGKPSPAPLSSDCAQLFPAPTPATWLPLEADPLADDAAGRERAPATLGEVLARLGAMNDLPRQRRDDLCSAVRRVTGLIGIPAADIPADAAVLRRRLSILTPAGAGMTPRRFKNVRALLTAALDLTGAKVVRRHSRYALTPAWRNLLARVNERYERARLSRFFGYASGRGVEPGGLPPFIKLLFERDEKDRTWPRT